MDLKRFLPLLLLLYGTCCIAQTKRVVLETTFGERMICQFSENPKLTHNDKTVTLATSRVTVTYQTSEITKVYIDGDSSTKIESVNIDGEKIIINDDAVYLTGLSNGQIIRVYSVKGDLVKSLPVSDNGSVTIQLTNLPKGLYIIKTKNQSFKITRK